MGVLERENRGRCARQEVDFGGLVGAAVVNNQMRVELGQDLHGSPVLCISDSRGLVDSG
jgi:hypothetical protein